MQTGISRRSSRASSCDPNKSLQQDLEFCASMRSDSRILMPTRAHGESPSLSTMRGRNLASEFDRRRLSGILGPHRFMEEAGTPSNFPPSNFSCFFSFSFSFSLSS